jgi:hypothetical protein
MIYYIIYETINLVNNKKYCGAHVCEDLNDGYLGSGSRLKDAIRKYGKDKFSREILFMAFDYDAMWAAEAILVDQTWIDRPDTYNICLGGRGSRGYKRITSDNTLALQSIRGKERWARLDYRLKNIESQKQRRHPEVTRLKMSKSHSGIPNSESHSNNISAGLKKRFEDPAARLQRSIQATETNNRPEVKSKIQQALTGIQRSEETKQRNKLAAQKRVKDPKYLERQSVSQTQRWEENPATWWNNGEKSVRSVEQPGPEWKPGRVNFGTWWTNGKKSVMSVMCPGDGWSPGRKLKKST